MNLVSRNLANESFEIMSKAKHSVKVALSDEDKATQVVSVLGAVSHCRAQVELYVKFDNWSPGGLEEWERILSKGVQVFWDPEVDRSVATIDGLHYSLEDAGATRVESKGFRFRKIGFFGILRGKLVVGQRIGGDRGFPVLIVIEQGGGRYPVFVGRGRTPSELEAGDTLRVAYLSIVGERTFSGSSPPAEVFLEALSVERIERHREGKPLVWLSAKNAIHELLAESSMPPSKGKKKEAWIDAARARILSSLRKRMIYIDADDERYLYAKLHERAGSGAD